MMVINGGKLIQRLINCGYTEANAIDICQKYAADKNLEGLEHFIRLAERFDDDRNEYV